MKWKIHMTFVIHNLQIVDDKDMDMNIEHMKQAIIDSVKYGDEEEIKKNITYHMFPWDG